MFSPPAPTPFYLLSSLFPSPLPPHSPQFPLQKKTSRRLRELTQDRKLAFTQMEDDNALKATAARRLEEQAQGLVEAALRLQEQALRLHVNERSLHESRDASVVLQRAAKEAARRLLELGEGKDNFLVQSLNAAARPTTAPALPRYDGDADPIAAATPSRTDNTELIRQLEAESQGVRRLKETHDDHIEHDRPLARRLAGGPDNC